MAPSASPTPVEQEDEDDYLSMTFAEPTSTKPARETLTQRKWRLALEAETRGRPKSKAEIAVEEEKKRVQALDTPTLNPTNKGFKMMAALGYKAGETLGTGKQNGLLEPVGVEMKIDRGGIGADAERKRKIREEVERVVGEEKRRKVDEGDYRERVAAEREEKRKEGQLAGARKVAERLEEEDEQSNSVRVPRQKPLKMVNVLWRGLVKNREITERDKRMRHDLQQSLPSSRLPGYEDDDEDDDDKLALGKERKAQIEVEDIDLDEEDPELDVFEALEIDDKLKRVTEFLRQKWHYCFWCKYRYPDAEMEGCPGVTEEEHD